MTFEDEQFLRRIDGLFVGLLNDDEFKAFSRLVTEGHARRVYEGAGGLLGLAKVPKIKQRKEENVKSG